MRSRALVALLCALASAAVGARSIRAQPPEGCGGEVACPDVGLTIAKPADAEWTVWIGAGGGSGDLGGSDHAVFAVRAGAAVDFELARFGPEHQYGGPVLVRAGPWIGGETLLDTHFAEAGLTIDLGQTYHAQWGTVGLRLGGGGAMRDLDWSLAGSVTLTWGVRSVPERYRDGGACVGRDGELWGVDTGPPASAVAFASGMRLFGTLRATTEGYAAVIVGVEFEPTFVLPPYSLSRWGGSRPH